MALFILSVPLMALAVAAAVIPLLVISHREHQRHQAGLPVAAYTYRGGASDPRVVYEAAAKR
jgi:hypothetical protein